MFTGLIEELGLLLAARTAPGSRTLEIRAPKIAPELRIGDSVCVNGVCLTATAVSASGFAAQATGASLEKTTLPFLNSGSALNLERALRADSRLDGHLVQGHVRATGRVLGWEGSGDTRFLSIALDAELASDLREEGSIAIDGVSLTVASASPGPGSRVTARVSLIPHTLASTNLGALRPGSPVNVETDALLRRSPLGNKGLDLNTLKAWGYA